MQRLRNMAKSILLLGVLLLLIGGNIAFSQNTGAGPYIDSWHTYRVVMGNASNYYEWDLTQVSTTDTTHLVTQTGGELQTWVDNSITSSNNDISVFFGNANFSAGEQWELLYREYSSGGTCIAARKFTISLTENNFYLTLAVNDTLCKTQSGQLFSWENVDDEVFTATLVYRVTLHKEAGHTLNSWSFGADIDLNPANHNYVNYSVSVVPVTEGTAVLTDTPTTLDGEFSVAVSALTTPTLTEVAVDVRVDLSGRLQDGIAATLNLLNGIAVSGSVGTVITYDNLSRPTAAAPDNVSDAALRDRLQVIVLDPIPATQNILPGAGETATSASNPLQYSTHRYVVTMGDKANNYTNTGTGWYIEEADGDPVANDAANYVLAHYGSSPTNDTISIRYNMAPGEYVIYFAEVGDNGCSTIRSFPITLGDPFDADILTVDDQCSGAYGVIFQNLQDSTTTIEYTVALDMTYTMNWEFGIEVTSTPGFSNPDLEVSSISILGTYAVYTSATTTSGTVAVTNSTGTVNSVTVRVVYHGLYESAHTITLTLPDGTIHGSFGETDRDDGTTLDGGGTEGDINQARHIMHAMPQAGTLAGID